MKGLVIKNTGSWYTVRLDDGQLLDCKIKGNFRLKGIRSTNPVAVGDRVEVVEGFITAIEDRRNYIIRKSQNLSKQSHWKQNRRNQNQSNLSRKRKPKSLNRLKLSRKDLAPTYSFRRFPSNEGGA